MDVQRLQDDADVRIKFASLNHKGEFVRDAGDEYLSFFESINQGWQVTQLDPVIVEEYGRNNAWKISDGDNEIAAVAHETGVEFLMAIQAALAIEVIKLVAEWGWKRWNELRPTKVASSFQIAKVSKRSKDRRTLVVEKVELRGPISTEDVKGSVQEFVGFDKSLQATDFK